ncbi:MAG TPA: DegT/DnrJ/EryC1/StrS family aminotransferase [Dokdonella sp.]|nr:DegT/DnrJ/EryC1/StrS family aminotransferase [Dokdonella sp.]
MPTSRPHRTEIPPTAGLPPRCGDLWPLPPRQGGLEREAAAFIGVDEVQAECSGTAALVVALTALHRLVGRRVVVAPAFTCPLVAIAVAHCGLELRLCDLAPGSIDLDEDALARACDRDVLAVLPTHLGGRVADVAAAVERARAVGAFVVEDAAQALGARRDRRSVGLEGDAGFFSLAVGKGLTTYEGGLLVSTDASLRRELRRTSRDIVAWRPGWELRRSFELLGYHAFYRPSLLRLAYGLPLRRALRRGDVVAAVGDDFPLRIPLHRLGRWRRNVGAHAFARLPAFVADCRLRAIRRCARLATIPGVAVIGDPAGADGSWPFLLLKLPDPSVRDAILARLWSEGRGVSRLFVHALPDYAYLRGVVGDADVPNARRFAATTLTISNSPWLDEADFDAVCAVIAHQLQRLDAGAC